MAYNPSSSLSEHFTDFCDQWIVYKEKAETIKTKDAIGVYMVFLKSARNELTKVYQGMKNVVWREFMADILQQIDKELKKTRKL